MSSSHALFSLSAVVLLGVAASLETSTTTLTVTSCLPSMTCGQTSFSLPVVTSTTTLTVTSCLPSSTYTMISPDPPFTSKTALSHALNGAWDGWSRPTTSAVSYVPDGSAWNDWSTPTASAVSYTPDGSAWNDWSTKTQIIPHPNSRSPSLAPTVSWTDWSAQSLNIPGTHSPVDAKSTRTSAIIIPPSWTPWPDSQGVSWSTTGPTATSKEPTASWAQWSTSTTYPATTANISQGDVKVPDATQISSSSVLNNPETPKFPSFTPTAAVATYHGAASQSFGTLNGSLLILIMVMGTLARLH